MEVHNKSTAINLIRSKVLELLDIIMNKLEMLIQSVEARYDNKPEIYYYNLSCSLLNIYKGRCNLFVVSNKTNLKQELIIKHDRAIMEGNLIVSNDLFYKNFNILFHNKFRRKIEFYP